VACLPQAWAAGAVFMMLQACLGITVNGVAREIDIVDPRLPIGIDELHVRGLRVGRERLDLDFRRMGDHVAVTTPRGARAAIRFRGAPV
jgi:hypothetical protein